MSIAPFPPVPPGSSSEGRRARLAVVAASVGIVAVLTTYAVSPGVRHAVNHAAHSVNNIFDHDRKERAEQRGRRHRAQTQRPSHARTGEIPAHAVTALAVSSSAPVQGEQGPLPSARNAPT